MSHRPFLLAVALASGVASAQVSQEDHSAHHPPGGGSSPAAAPVSPAQPATTDKVAEQMKKMQDMHKRMQAAKTPAERQALLDEHMKLMQSGMQMMSRMGGAQGTGGPMGAASGAGNGMGGMMDMHTAMERRMAMMEQMMQMMVDREAAMPRK
jgi:hypothetical protein